LNIVPDKIVRVRHPIKEASLISWLFAFMHAGSSSNGGGSVDGRLPCSSSCAPTPGLFNIVPDKIVRVRHPIKEASLISWLFAFKRAGSSSNGGGVDGRLPCSSSCAPTPGLLNIVPDKIVRVRHPIKEASLISWLFAFMHAGSSSNGGGSVDGRFHCSSPCAPTPGLFNIVHDKVVRVRSRYLKAYPLAVLVKRDKIMIN
jgi:hypothetical protein